MCTYTKRTREGLFSMKKKKEKRKKRYEHTMSHSKNYMAYKDWVVADTTYYNKPAFDTCFIQLISATHLHIHTTHNTQHTSIHLINYVIMANCLRFA